MRAYVINMPRSTYRREAMDTMLTGMGIDHEFVTAVDGREMSEEEFLASVQDANEFTRSQAGCALSHIKAYQRILEGEDEFGIVFEDDILITEPNFKQLLQELTPKLDKNKITQLTYYWCREGFLDLSPKANGTLKAGKHEYQLCEPNEVHGIGRAAAYIISKELCKRMVDFNMPLYAQADSWVVFHQKKAIGGVDCVYPMPVTENDQFGSEIGYTRSKTEQFLKDMVTKAVNANIPIITPMIKKKRQRFAQNYKNIRLNKQ